MHATAPQLRLYRRLVSQLGWDDETRRIVLKDRYNALSSTGLTKPQMAEMIDWMKHSLGERPYAPTVTRGGCSTWQADLIERLEAELGWRDNPARLGGFIRRLVGREAAPDELTAMEADSIIEALKCMLRRATVGADLCVGPCKGAPGAPDSA